jgi:uncharacterized protein DUF3703
MNSELRKAFEAEFAAGRKMFSDGQLDQAFHHFERAHVLGQFYVFPHVRTHIWMLFIGLRKGDFREILGQMLRIPLAMIGSALGKVPLGNTGGANVELTKPMPIPDDLQKHLDS